MAKKLAKKRGRSLNAFLRAERLRACVVCSSMPIELQQQMRDGILKRRLALAVCLAWLKAEHGISITPDQWKVHTHGHHANLGGAR